MKFNKFKTLAATTVLVAAGIGMNSAHAVNYGSVAGDSYDQPTATQSVDSTTQAQIANQEAVSNFFKGVWGKTKEVASNVSEKTTELMNKNTDSSNPQEPAKVKAQNEHTKELMSKKTTQHYDSDRVGSVSDISIYHEGPTAKKNNTSKAKKASVENKEEPKIQKAEVQMPGPITSEDVIKAKDKVIDGVSGFLNKLRSQPQSDNNNTPKP